MTLRTAFVTGASSGIGRALCERLAADGVEVCLAARREDVLAELAAEIEGRGGKARVFPVDVADPRAVIEALERADDELGGIDVVVANAGIGRQRWSGKLVWEDVEPMLATNVLGAAATLTALIPRMVERRRGALVGVSSLAQYRGLPKNAAYSGTKAFLSRFLEGLRVDLRQTGVSVIDVRPGFVRTAMTDGNPSPMPFLMDAGEAADHIARGIHRGSPVVAFPWQLATIARSSTLLPAAVFDRAVARAKG